MTEHAYDSVSPFVAGLRCRCPRCADSGDGPAVFIMFIAGFLIVGAALLVELRYEPPFWVHAALWIPGVLIVSLGLLRPLKGLMIALQFANQAEEGRLER